MWRVWSLWMRHIRTKVSDSMRLACHPHEGSVEFKNQNWRSAKLDWRRTCRCWPPIKKMPNQRDIDDQAAKAYASTSLGAMLKESEAVEQTLAEAGTFRHLGDRPVYVLTAMKPLPEEALAQLKLTPEQGRQCLTNLERKCRTKKRPGHRKVSIVWFRTLDITSSLTVPILS